MNSIKTLGTCLFVMASLLMQAQETTAVKGRVTDLESGEALEGASIILKGSTPVVGTSSDYEGYYRLDNAPVGSVSIEIQFLGYTPVSKTVTTEAGKDLLLQVDMQPAMTQLEEVVISRSNLHFKHMELYNEEGKTREERNINGFYALEIFKDAITGELWGLGKSQMLEVKPNTDLYYKGTTSLEIQWDKLKDHTKWLGFGIGWDQWSGKNIELVQDSCGIQFYMRSMEGPMKNLVIVFHLEDYSGSMCSAVMKDNNFYAGGQLTEKWSKVTIPFSAFTFNRETTDLSNIKQMILQFEVKAHILIDEMEIVKLEPAVEQ